MESTPIYTLRPAEVFAALATSPDGLSPGEVAARQELYGPNLLAVENVSPVWQKLLSHLVHPLSGLLVLAGLIAFIVRKPLLGSVIWVLVLVNAVFSYLRERRTEQAMQALHRLLPAYTRVLRAGSEQNVPASELVPGDVLLLAEGDNIPADARVIEAYGLRANHAVLTGEAVAVAKTADAALMEGVSEVERPNLIFAGTSIVAGTGRAVVFATGMLTQFGRIAHLTGSVQEAPSPLQKELLKLTRRIAWIAAGLGVVVFVVGSIDLHLGYLPAFLLALGILVAAVPEGLPATLTLTLAMSGQRLAQHNVLVKKLSVIETLGAVSMICTDKSGTLTQNQMTVREIWAGGERWRVTGGGYEPKGKIIPANGSQPNREALKLLLSAAMYCNNSRLRPPGINNQRWSALGDQTEAAMRVAAMKGGLSEEGLNKALPRIHELPFEARRKRMSTIHRLGDVSSLDGIKSYLLNEPDRAADRLSGDRLSGDRLSVDRAEFAFVKGAPREVLALCVQAVVGLEIKPLSPELRAQIEKQNDDYARGGMRVLALAFRQLPPRSGAYTQAGVERELTFLGLMAMMDPPRQEVADAVQVCKQAGIRMVMITGDYGLTAESLARRIGMLADGETEILTGNELDELDDAGLEAILDRQIVYARMAPEHKMRLVSAFQAHGEVVAVTGDGVNDAPALRKADVGVAMGITGTDVAREAADIVLVNDNFAGITHAIEEGRAVYDNLRKFLTYIFSSNVPEVLPFALTAVTGIPLALTVPQILAIDMGTDLLPGLALGSEKPEPDIMQRPPRRRSQPLIDRQLLRRAFLWLGLIETALAYSGFALVYGLAGKGPLAGILQANHLALPAALRALPLNLLAITAFHAGVVTAQAGNAFACRSEVHRGVRLGWFSNRFLIVGVAVQIVLILALIYVPFLAVWFDHTALPPVFWLWLGFYPLILYSLEWVRKAIVRKMR